MVLKVRLRVRRFIELRIARISAGLLIYESVPVKPTQLSRRDT
jgi:hypothetical protein